MGLAIETMDAPPVSRSASAELREHLQQKLIEANSYAERMKILTQLQQAYGQAPEQLVWEDQVIDQMWMQECIQHPAHIKAIFLEGSLVKDDLLYAEYKSLRVQEKVWHDSAHIWVAALKTNHNFYQLNQAEKKELLAQIWKAFNHNPVVLPTKEPTLAVFRAHLIEHTPIAEKLTGPQLDRLAEAIFERRDSLHSRPKAVKRYVDDGKPRWHAFADVTQEQEAALMEILRSQKAKVRANPMELPTYYASRYHSKLSGGKRLSLKVGEDQWIHYVPHHELGEKKATEHRHRAHIKFPPQFFQDEEDRIQAQLDQVAAPLDQLRMKVRGPHRILCRLPADEEQRQLIMDATGSGESIKVGWIEASYENVTADDLVTGGYQPLDDQRWAPRRSVNIHAEASKALAWLRENPAQTLEWQSRTAHAPESVEQQHSQATTHQERQARANRNKMTQTLRRHMGQQDCPPRAHAMVHNHAERYYTHEHEAQQLMKEIPHVAPMSERGVLKFENLTPYEAIAHMERLGMSRGLSERVPYQNIYHNRARRLGRVTPHHEDYTSGEENISLPEGHMFLHALTGARDQTAVLERLDAMQSAGGLKSTSERRRMGILVKSLSPIGDTSCGVDQGVPTKIGDDSAYDSPILFAMSPDLIKRRDMFFADHNFGSGPSNYTKFTAYAEQIGQERIHKPASHVARQHHLENGLGPSNEAYLKHQIAWEEMDTVFVREDLYQAVKEKIDGWKKSKQMPHRLRVVSVPPADMGKHTKTGKLQKLIRKRALQLAARAHISSTS